MFFLELFSFQLLFLLFFYIACQLGLRPGELQLVGDKNYCESSHFSPPLRDLLTALETLRFVHA